MSQLVEFAGNHPFMVMLFLTVLFLYLNALYKEKSTAYKQVNVDQLTRLVNQQNAQLIDVRPKEAFAEGHIVNAINLPLLDLDTIIAERIGLEDINAGKVKLDKLKKKPVIVYCQVGRSSAAASKKLNEAGFEQVFNLQGGINAWLNDKLPLSKA